MVHMLQELHPIKNFLVFSYIFVQSHHSPDLDSQPFLMGSFLLIQSRVLNSIMLKKIGKGCPKKIVN